MVGINTLVTAHNGLFIEKILTWDEDQANEDDKKIYFMVKSKHKIVMNHSVRSKQRGKVYDTT